MALRAGTRLGVYEITAPIGAGGMGEVYRARDTKLGRDVALKILPDAFASDIDRLARFQREAQVLASLNHQNIGHIYGLEESNGISALVLELVEGPTLADRIAQGRIPIDEALPIARQIADALEEAHEKSIIHRDLKPANIKLPPDGTVKVLDFGLAKLTESSTAPGADAALVSQSPTITTPAMMTGVGMVLGTAAYMSPEQAKGRPADKRSDLWAFGCVLYEMIAGARAFPGEDVGDTLASVLKSEPDWSALPAEVPRSVWNLLRRCLTKDRARRLDSAVAARLEIDDALMSPVRDEPRVSGGGWHRVAAATIAAVVITGGVVGTVFWYARRPAPLRLIRTVIPTSGVTALSAIDAGPLLTITPDGTQVVYRGAGQIFVRALDQLEPRPLVDHGRPTGLFMAPDGQSVGFFDGGVSLNKVAIASGTAMSVAAIDAPPRGATWGTDGTIVFATAGERGLQRVSASGGEVTVLTTPEKARGEADHVWPEFLPDGQAVLFTIIAAGGGEDASQVAALDLQTGKQTVLLRGGSHARYVPTGHLVFAAGGGLRAVTFDLERRVVTGTPVPILGSVGISRNGAAEAAVAGNGTLVYLASGTLATRTQRTLVWVDRRGREEPLAAPPRSYQAPRISPDGTRVALTSADEEQDVWVWDLARTTLTQLTFDPGLDEDPLWMPDSRRLLFSSNRAGAPNLYVQAADGTGSATRLTDSPRPQFPTSFTPDGRIVIFEATPTHLRDLRLLTLGPTPRFEPLVETRYDDRNGVVSPDGRWLAYDSDRSGRYEIYVRPFMGDGLWKVSTAGGIQPLWAPRGHELFYVAPDGALMAISVDVRAATWSADAPTRLIEGRYFTGPVVIRHYDVTKDGQRFLMLKDLPANAAASAPIVVVQNWLEELNRLVPTK